MVIGQNFTHLIVVQKEINTFRVHSQVLILYKEILTYREVETILIELKVILLMREYLFLDQHQNHLQEFSRLIRREYMQVLLINIYQDQLELIMLQVTHVLYMVLHRRLMQLGQRLTLELPIIQLDQLLAILIEHNQDQVN